MLGTYAWVLGFRIKMSLLYILYYCIYTTFAEDWMEDGGGLDVPVRVDVLELNDFNLTLPTRLEAKAREASKRWPLLFQELLCKTPMDSMDRPQDRKSGMCGYAVLTVLQYGY